jgi:phenylalanyl-tRNA synthetase beta chain
MKVSLNWVRSINDKYGCSADPAPDGIDKLVEKIGAQLGAVEEVIDLGKKYEGIIVAKVISCEKHPNADKLSVCVIDDNGTSKGVKRNKDGHVQVVCGAPNVAPTLAVAWIPPGVVVPVTYDKDPFRLEAREIRGVLSSGMIASAKELGLGDDHSGILVIDPPVKPGQSFAKAAGLDDFVIDIENKMFTHRPDLFGLLGIARELAGIQGHNFKSPAWYREDASITKSRADGLKLSVKNELPKLVPRFCAVVIKDVKVADSPLWLKAHLTAVGIRPINNIVDLTNFLMYETAQPLHAYDYDKLGGQIVVRKPKLGETLDVIGGKKIKLRPEDIVIASTDKPIGLGGVMGGAGTEVDGQTRNIVLEAATFDMNAVRKTAMTHGLFTDAATRFTKNQSPRQNRAVLAKAAGDILKIAGGRIVSDLIDNLHVDAKPETVEINADFINSRLGLELSPPTIKKLLENVEFKVQAVGQRLKIGAPFWRTDIAIPEDIVEEVGRLYGYDRLPLVLPERTIRAAAEDPLLSFKSRLQDILTRGGANEALTYSFVDEALLRTVGQNPEDAYHIRNALSPNLQYYRISLAPSLLAKVHSNIKAGFEEFALFEVGKGHKKGAWDEEKLPKELERLSLVIASKSPKAGAPYFTAKKYCDYLLGELRAIGVSYEPLDLSTKMSTVSYYEPARAAHIKLGSKIIGCIGEFKPSVCHALKLPRFCAGFDIHTDELMQAASSIKYRPLGRYPSLSQDLCLRTSADLSYAQLTEFVTDFLGNISGKHGYIYQITPLDIFQKKGDEKFKQTTWRISFEHPEKTLTTVEVNKILDELSAQAKKQLKAERV